MRISRNLLTTLLILATCSLFLFCLYIWKEHGVNGVREVEILDTFQNGDDGTLHRETDTTTVSSPTTKPKQDLLNLESSLNDESSSDFHKDTSQDTSSTVSDNNSHETTSNENETPVEDSVSPSPTPLKNVIALGDNEIYHTHTPDLDVKSPQELEQLKGWYEYAYKNQEIFSSPEIEERPNVIHANVLLDLYAQPVDFVIAIKYVHCSVKLSVRNINMYLKPRYIWFISAKKEHCKTLVTLANNIKCVWEDEIFPNLTSQKLKEIITHEITSKRRGWYYLQLLNFGVARHLPDLAKTYVVWDSDNVPMSSDLTFFNYDKRKYQFYTQKDHYHSGLAHGYHGAYKKLTGYDILHPDPRFTPNNPTKIDDYKSETWVAHFMVWHKPIVREIMNHIEKFRNVPAGDWNLEVCRVIQEPDHAKYYDGFADYDTYGSWMKRFHMSQVEALMKSYKRAIRPEKTRRYKKGTCCVPKEDYAQWQKQNLLNVVIEIHKGDKKSCQTDNINMVGLRDGDSLLT